MGRKARRIRPDVDIPEMTEAEYSRVKAMRPAVPKVVEANADAEGRKRSTRNNACRSDSPPASWRSWKGTGPGWQSRISDVLAAALPKRTGKRG